MAGRSRLAVLVIAAAALAACRGNRPEETAVEQRPAAAGPDDAGASPRNAGVLGGVEAPDPGPTPGLPLEPYDACQERIAHVRQLACAAAIDRAGPRVTQVRDAILQACSTGGADALACLQAATSFEEAARCPKVPAARSPGDCEAIRLHAFSLELVDRTCHGPAPIERDTEHFLVNRLGGFVSPEPWATTCGKAQPIPQRILRCVLDSTTADQYARCGL